MGLGLGGTNKVLTVSTFSLFSLFHHFLKKVFLDLKLKNNYNKIIHIIKLFKKTEEKMKNRLFAYIPPNPFIRRLLCFK